MGIKKMFHVKQLLVIGFLLGVVLSAIGEAVEPVVIETIAYEASGTSFFEQQLVSKVIQTRSKKRGLTSSEVVLQPYQFSCNNKGQREKMKKRTEEELATAKNAYFAALNNDLPEIDLYHDKTINPPYWAKNGKSIRVLETESFVFYLEKAR